MNYTYYASYSYYTKCSKSGDGTVSVALETDEWSILHAKHALRV
jgi:hypothetical protein